MSSDGPTGRFRFAPKFSGLVLQIEKRSTAQWDITKPAYQAILWVNADAMDLCHPVFRRLIDLSDDGNWSQQELQRRIAGKSPDGQ